MLTKDQSFKEVKIFNLAKHIIDRHNNLKKSVINENLYNSKIRLIISTVFDFVNQLCMAALMVLIIITVVSGKLLIGSAVALLRVIGMVFDNFNNIMNIIYSINQNSLYMSKLIGFLSDNKLKSNNGSEETQKLSHITEIQINNLNFSYPNANKEALKNINLKIKKGERIAFLEETAQGKVH